jgi:ribosomal protein S6
MDKELGQVGNDARVYEAGFHVIPTVGDEHLGAEVTKVRDAIESAGGKVFADEYPKHRDLAYPVVKVASNKRSTYHTAYFGWMKFDADPKVVAVVDAALKSNDKILRYILVETVRENTMSPRKFVRERKGREERPADAKSKEEKPQMTEEEIDKTIEDLVIS